MEIKKGKGNVKKFKYQPIVVTFIGSEGSGKTIYLCEYLNKYINKENKEKIIEINDNMNNDIVNYYSFLLYKRIKDYDDDDEKKKEIIEIKLFEIPDKEIEFIDYLSTSVKKVLIHSDYIIVMFNMNCEKFKQFNQAREWIEGIRKLKNRKKNVQIIIVGNEMNSVETIENTLIKKEVVREKHLKGVIKTVNDFIMMIEEANKSSNYNRIIFKRVSGFDDSLFNSIVDIHIPVKMFGKPKNYKSLIEEKFGSLERIEVQQDFKEDKKEEEIAGEKLIKKSNVFINEIRKNFESQKFDHGYCESRIKKLMILRKKLYEVAKVSINNEIFKKTTEINDIVESFKTRSSEVKFGKLIYNGKWDENDLKKGFGTLYVKNKRLFKKSSKNQQVLYVGTFSRGLYNGTGKIFHKNGNRKFYGTFIYGKRDGLGIQYDLNGKIIKRGRWKDDSYVQDLYPKDVEEMGTIEKEKFMNDVYRNESRNVYLVGSGSFSEVFKYNKKAYKVFVSFTDHLDKIETEVKLLSGLKHENILEFCSVSWKDPVCLVTELCDESVDEFISDGIKKKSEGKQQFGIDFDTKESILFQTAIGLEYLHSNNIIHRDLKWNNVLIKKHSNDKRVIKIADFGFSKVVESYKRSRKDSFLGTFQYIAPELHVNIGLKKKERIYSYPIDVFAYGIMMHELIFETKDPFNVKNTILFGAQLSSEIARGMRPIITKQMYSVIPKDKKYLINMMKRCWESLPSQRPTFCEIVREISSNSTTNDFEFKFDENIGERIRESHK